MSKIALRGWLVVGTTGLETGFSLLKLVVKVLSSSSFSAERAKQKSDILF